MSADPVAEWAQQHGLLDLPKYVDEQRAAVLRRERAVLRGHCPDCEDQRCIECDATGDCVCSCDDEHDCAKCDGTGFIGDVCTSCHGTGLLPEPSA